MRRAYASAPDGAAHEAYRTAALPGDAPGSPQPHGKSEVAARRWAAASRARAYGLAAVALATLALALLTGRLQAPLPAGDRVSTLPPYVVFVDAGSTGSRVHVFQITPRAPPAFRVRAATDKFASNVPLASLAGKDDEEIWAAFAPLVARAEAAVPAAARPRTPLFVWATAGMRLLPPAAQGTLYDALYGLVRTRSGFAVSRAEGFRTLEGRDEGVYGWLAANALAGADLTRTLPGAPLPRTLGALDLGGGSAQVVSAAAAALTRAGPRGLPSVEADVYARSYLGFGAVAMEARVKAELAAKARNRDGSGNADAAASDDVAGGAVVNPCGFAGHAETLPWGDATSSSEDVSSSASSERGFVQLRGGGDFAGCVAAVRAALAAMQAGPGGIGPVALPAAAMQDTYMGMALFYHVAHFLALALPKGDAPPFPRPTLRELRRGAAALCGTPWAAVAGRMAGAHAATSAARLPGRCFDAVLVTTLLGGAPLTPSGHDTADVPIDTDDVAAVAARPRRAGDARRFAATSAAAPPPLQASPPDGSGFVGYGFDPDARRFVFVDKVKGTEVEWTLGAAIASLQPLAAAQAALAQRAAAALAAPLAAAATALAAAAVHARAQASPACCCAGFGGRSLTLEASSAEGDDVAAACGVLGRARAALAAALRGLRASGGRAKTHS